MEFIFDPSLVLYLPLYELDGVSFASKDAYRHLGTVTGALWRPNGRYFDGTDDRINCGSGVSIDDITAKTIEVWLCSYGDAGAGRLVMKANANASGFNVFYHDGVTEKRLGFIQHFSTSLGLWKTPVNSMSAEEWFHVAIVYDRASAGNDPTIYINAASQVVTEEQAPADSATSDAAQDLWVGARNNGGMPDAPFYGLVGEVRVYNRLLNPQEVEHNYLATKWRYR